MTNVKHDKLSDFPTSIDTPFIRLDELVYRKHYEKEKYKELKDTATGEIMFAQIPGKLKEGFKDKASYTKLFKGGKLKLAELSSSGIKVLCYIMLNATPNQEELCLHPSIVATEMGYKDPRSVYEGLVDLLNVQLLARKTGHQSCFWLNPNLFFNGDRTKLLTNPVRIDFVQELMDNYTRDAKDYANLRKD